MNVLVLHNDNLPAFLILESEIAEGINVFPLNMLEQKYDAGYYDSFICQKLSPVLMNNSFDLIIIPYSVSENPIEYTGLRCAAHIRLTPEWKSITTPILFLGPDRLKDVIKVSDLGEILTSFNVWYSSCYARQEIIDLCHLITNERRIFSDDREEILFSREYQNFLSCMRRMRAPSNYATHHSIANKWALHRWVEMLDLDSQVKLKDSDFLNMLYFKYLQMQAGTREGFRKSGRKKNTVSPKIARISHKRIIVIDDEINAGWGDLLTVIFKNSEAKPVFYPFSEETKKLSKQDLIDNINQFIKEDYDKEGVADCYIVDLRLHEDDYNNKNGDLSGISVIKDIKELNPVNQVLVFTASNKSWNIKKLIRELDVPNYIIKESPEQNLSTKSSLDLWNEFSKSLSHCCEMSYVAVLYKKLNEWITKDVDDRINFSSLKDFLRFLDLDDGQSMHGGSPLYIGTAAVYLICFLEGYIKQHFEISGEFNQNIKSNITGKDVQWYSHILIKMDDNDQLKSMIYSKEDMTLQSSSYSLYTNRRRNEILPVRDIYFISMVLLIFYGTDVRHVEEYILLKRQRNSVVHDLEEEKVDIKLIKEIYSNVVLPMIRQDLK